MFFGTFDYIILALIFIFNAGVWKYKIIKKRSRVLYLIAFLFFGFIIPFFSMDYEIQKAIKGQPFVDNFTLLYTFLRFPIWWLIGFLEIIFLKVFIRK